MRIRANKTHHPVGKDEPLCTTKGARRFAVAGEQPTCRLCEFLVGVASHKLGVRETGHRERHLQLHHALGELVADWIRHTDATPSVNTVIDLLNWSRQQAEQPTETPAPAPSPTEPHAYVDDPKAAGYCTCGKRFDHDVHGEETR